MKGSSDDMFNATTAEDLVNVTLSCAAESIHDPVVLPYSKAFITTVTALRAIFWLLLLPSGIVLNTLVIVLFAKYKKLRNYTFAITFQIVGMNLLLSVVSTVFPLTNMLAMRWVFDEFMCSIVGIFAYATT